LSKLETGEPLWQVEAEGDRSAYSMAFSRDGKRLAVAVHGQVYVYATADKKLIKRVVVYPTFGDFDIAFTADGQKLVSTAKRHAQLWDIATGKRLRHFGSFSDVCHSVNVSPDGRYLVTSHTGSDGRIWEIETGMFYRRLGKNVRPRG
jgi:WD40 repeat protein